MVGLAIIGFGVVIAALLVIRAAIIVLDNGLYARSGISSSRW